MKVIIRKQYKKKGEDDYYLTDPEPETIEITKEDDEILLEIGNMTLIIPFEVFVGIFN